MVITAFLLCLSGSAAGYDLTLSDPAGDDYGPGGYVYPLDPVFTAGTFDMVGFSVRNIGPNVRFQVEIAGEIEDPWGSGAGFSLQSIDIYIDQDGLSGSGSTAALERRNVEFSPSSGWEYVVWCAPPFDGFESHVVDSGGTTYYSGISVSVDQDDDVITVDVPMSIIGAPEAGWNYVVLMLGQNGYEPGRIRPVVRDVSQWVFGGGHDGQWDSNVIDMIAGVGVDQEALLSNYDPVAGLHPILINRVDASAPSIAHTPPSSWEAHVPLTVQADIEDDVVVSASVFHRYPGGTYQAAVMHRTGGIAWVGTVPGSEIEEGGLEYFIYATDATNANMLPDSSYPFTVTITPDVNPASITLLEARPAVFSPDGDGYKDSTLVVVGISEPGHVSLGIRDSLGTTVRTLTDSTFVESTLITVWDGRYQSGQTAADGSYWIVADCIDLGDHPAAPESAIVEVDNSLSVRTLDVILLFHANQNLVPYGRAANRACYKGVLNTLRAHPTLKFLIHFSGSLLSDLLWSDPEVIDILRQGAADGQFEIVGSTYIQNIIYSTRSSPDDFQFNQHQIAIHKALIEDVLGVSPVSFWNPERVWTQNIVKLLTDNGYQNVQVEDHILYDSGITGSEYAVRTTTYQGESVYVFDDDKTFEGYVNGAIDSGDTSSVMWFLRGLYDEDVDDLYAVCYHEDMEATGLWDYENGEDPAVDFANLDKLLTAFESDPRIKVTTYSDFVENHDPYENISPIADGAADWMGRDAWFDENAAPEAEAYRSFFDAIRDTINAIHSTFASYVRDTVGARNLIDHAWFTLCAHQYEFAVHGYQGMLGTTQWDLARTALVSARAARAALAAEPGAWVEDINDDGIDEIVFATTGDLFVLSTYGGRLLYWFNLEDGAELVGNENFMRRYGEPYTNDNAYVPIAVGCEAYPWLCGNMIIPEIHEWTYEARRRCFNDSVWIDDVSQGALSGMVLDYDLDSSSVDFHYDLGTISITKSLSLALHSLSVGYAFSSSSSQPVEIEIALENGLSPDCRGVMLTGRQSLRYWDGQDTSSVFIPSMRGVTNVESGKGLLLDFTSAPAALGGEENIFGLEINLRWVLEIPPHGSEVVSIGLDLASFSGVTPPQPERVHGKVMVFPNPSRGRVALRIGIDAGLPVTADVFDLSGRHVRTLKVPKIGEPCVIRWDGLNQDGLPVAGGMYFVRVSLGSRHLTGKIAILR